MLCSFYYIHKLMIAFLMIFRRFPTTFEDFPKLFRRPDEHSRTFSKNCRKFPKKSEDFRRLPKTIEEDPKMFRWWNDAYLSIAFLHGGARFTKLLYESRSVKQLSEGPGLNYVSQTLFWFVMQQHKNKRNYNLRSTSEILLQQPRIKTLRTLGDRSFAVAAPTLWNKCN